MTTSSNSSHSAPSSPHSPVSSEAPSNSQCPVNPEAEVEKGNGNEIVAVSQQGENKEPSEPTPAHAAAGDATPTQSSRDVDGKKEQVGFEKRAKCRYCGTDLAADSSFNGTSTLRRHVEKVCKKYPGRENLEETQQVLISDGQTEPTLNVSKGWSQEACVQAACEMIVIDELPFSHIENEGFRWFCKVAIPRFEVPSRRKIVRCFLEMYERKKEELRMHLSGHRVCLTTDTWTSVQNINYMVLTAHFIDHGWKLHKRILNFCVIPSHKGTAIGKLLETCLVQWKIDKVLTVSIDNASANKVAIDYLRRKMAGWKNPPIFGGKFMHVRCLAHILNIIVRVGLHIMDRSCAAIRNAVKYIRSSSSRLNCFKLCVEKETPECQRIPVLDVPTRCNSTFLMLDTALEVRPAFDRLAEEEDQKYSGYLDEDEELEEEEDIESSVQKKSKTARKRVGPPVDADWDKAEIFVKFLRVFYDVTMRISATKNPTAHKAFHDIVAIQAEIDTLFVELEMSDGSETEKIMVDMAVKMRSKFIKYFGSIDDMNKLLLVALVLDPRFKLKNISHICTEMLSYDVETVKAKYNEVKELLLSLTDLYANSSNASSKSKSSTATSCVVSTSTQATATSSKSKDKKKISGKMADMLEGWQRALAESEEVVVESEVDRYLLDPMEKPKEDEDWQLLTWWKMNGCKYPNLAAVARGVLGIQVSTVASESCFSTGGRVIRSSLTPESVEALICLQNWIRKKDQSDIEYYPSIEELEFYEKNGKRCNSRQGKTSGRTN
ncbi:zinc finger BED domain-containing protein RICESLEEPER 2-like [Rosa rugosa]|uniref:zinc finger BED domain-containing protein RICESLEEPER 2-like n=1 Tax=Rosa rugosa TaxID=74645 RepID=UPI002B40340D|nr:zinc finger BED domain-containing protein RICESLEEPER 2-like [Rosa rugosa]